MMELLKRLVRAKIFMDDYYSNPIDLNHISDEACLSKYHFLRLFKKTYRITPYQYLLHKRLEKVKRELAHSNLPVSHICFQSGFNSVGAFNSIFKKIVGESPQFYRTRTQAKLLLAQNEPKKFIPCCFLRRFGNKK